MAISQSTVVCNLRSVLLVLEFMFFMVFKQSSFLLELKILFTSFLLTLLIDCRYIQAATNSKIFSGCLTARKVFARFGILNNSQLKISREFLSGA